MLFRSGYENVHTYQVKAAILIKHQILVTNLQGYILQLEGRVNNQILGVKEYLRSKKIKSRTEKYIWVA